MLEILRYGVLLSFCFTVVVLCLLVFKTYHFNKKKLHSVPQGNGRKGIIYALGRGLAPWEKESAGKHLPTYMAGILYHIGIFAALFYLFSLIIPFRVGSFFMMLLRIFILAGIFCGIGLFVKRSLKPHIRKISCPDDFASNLLVDVFLILSLVGTYDTRLEAILFAVSIILILYIPLGKIRHCVFFFYSRILFGFFFGRRGVLPQKQWHARSDHG
jgi:hypothetical protein